MPAASKKYLIILVLFSLPLFVINIHDKHGWGDDFSQYIKEAQNIAQGKPYYQSSWVFNKYNTVYAPPQYPPGYPLMLAPVVKIWGLSFRQMFLFNSFIAALLLFALFIYFARKGIDQAICVCLSLLIVYSGYLLDMKGNVLADIPCMLFTTLYLAYREGSVFSWRRILVLILLAAAAMQMRSQAIFLLAAEGLFMGVFFIKTIIAGRNAPGRALIQQPSLFIIAGVLALNFVFDKLLFPTPANTAAFYNGFMRTAMQQHLFQVAKDNMGYVAKTLAGFFHYNNANEGIMLFFGSAGFIFAITGFLATVSRRLAFDDIFFGIMCVVILYYPVHDPRYFLPALPILFYYCFVTLKVLIPAVSRIPFKPWVVGLTVILIATGSCYIKEITIHTAPGMIPEEREVQAFGYIKTHVNDTDVIVFDKPRALALFTGKRTMCVAWQESYEMNRKIFDSNHVRYILVLHGMDDDYFMHYIREVQHPVDSAEIGAGYTLYTLH